jgi:hypothetical protein
MTKLQRTRLALFTALMFPALVMAQQTQPVPRSPTTPQAPAMDGGGSAWWWIIVVAAVIIGLIWWASSRQQRQPPATRTP